MGQEANLTTQTRHHSENTCRIVFTEAHFFNDKSLITSVPKIQLLITNVLDVQNNHHYFQLPNTDHHCSQ